jgi:DnaJ domain
MRASPWFRIALIVLVAVVPAISAFLASPLQQRSFGIRSRQPSLIMPLSPRHQSRLSMSVWVSTDPFQVLNLSPTVDQREIKQAYKRMALKYHPDVVTNQDTSAEDKKKANDMFAEINWAYAQLSGKDATSSTTSSSSTSSYSPHHRRTSSQTYNPYEASTDWRDYVYDPFQTSADWRDPMPQYDDEQVYVVQDDDTGGDSIEKILADVFECAAVSAVVFVGEQKGIFRDFVEALERNVNGYAREVDDAELRILLNTGSVEDVGKEMEDAELVVQQLDLKRRDLAEELIILEAYLAKMGWVEWMAEVEARKQIVDGNLEQVHQWLLALQMRHEALLVRDGRSSSRELQSSSPYSTFSAGATSSASSRETANNYGTDDFSASSEDAWKHEKSSSSARGRGRSRRSRGRKTRSTDRSQRYPSSSDKPPSPRQESPCAPRHLRDKKVQFVIERHLSNHYYFVTIMDNTSPAYRQPSAKTQAQKDNEKCRELQV